MKRIFCLLAVLFLLAGCTNIDMTDQPDEPPSPVQSQPESSSSRPAQPVSELRLAYHMNDSFNPYEMETQVNRELVTLLYDSLTRPDKTYQPEMVLAESVSMQGTVCTVTFRRQVMFIDGTLLSAQDILYSLNLARTKGSWKTQLANVASAAETANGDVEIRLYQPDADFPLLLSFPIVKADTGQMDYPTGISKYFVSGTWGNTGVTLSENPLYYGGSCGIDTIRLVGVSDSTGLEFSLKTGDIDLIYTDLSVQQIGSGSASAVPVTLNHMVYLGMNARRGLLSQPNFRQALNVAINRDELVANAYSSQATVSRYPFNPEFYRMQGMELSAPRSLTRADELLDGLGLEEIGQDGYRMQRGEPVTLTLLVNSENTYRNAVATLIAEQLRQVGIRVNIISQAFAQFQMTLANGGFDLYVGEIRMTDNMDFSMLFNGGALGYGAAYDEEISALYRDYRRDGAGIEAFCEAFVARPPFLPLLFRQGQVSLNREFHAEMVATEQDIFYNIMEWNRQNTAKES